MAESSKITQYVRTAMSHYANEVGRDVLDATVAGVATGYAASKNLLDYTVGGFKVPLDLAAGLGLLAVAKQLPATYEAPLHAMSVGGTLIGIAAHRKSAEFFGHPASAAATAHGDFGFGFGADDPLLKAAAAL